VSVELNAAVESVTDREVRIKEKGTIETRNLIWTAGAAPTPFVRKLGVELKKGRLPTDEYLRVTGLENVWAVGDVAAIPDGSGGYYPPTAQHAMREGGRLAKNILNTIEGRELQRFRYATLGMMSTVGLNNGVIESFNFTLSGYPAWFLWRTYYLFRLPRIEKRIRVLLDWTLDLFFPRDIVQIQMSRRGRTD
jgi:NADH dehydrogenase